jgi:hypothetical protein
MYSVHCGRKVIEKVRKDGRIFPFLTEITYLYDLIANEKPQKQQCAWQIRKK